MRDVGNVCVDVIWKLMSCSSLVLQTCYKFGIIGECSEKQDSHSRLKCVLSTYPISQIWVIGTYSAMETMLMESSSVASDLPNAVCHKWNDKENRDLLQTLTWKAKGWANNKKNTQYHISPRSFSRQHLLGGKHFWSSAVTNYLWINVIYIYDACLLTLVNNWCAVISHTALDYKDLWKLATKDNHFSTRYICN